MSDVFISYARSTEKQAQRVVGALRALGYGVWRDDELPAHRDYSEVIEERLRAAKAVVVVWCAEAVKSQWVRAEADLAREAGTLVQLTLDGAALPMPFNRIQCADLTGWTGEPDVAGWRKVVASVADLVGSGAAPTALRPLASAVAPLTQSTAAWTLIKESLDPAEYSDFEMLYPGTPEVILARRHRRQIEAWATVDKSDAEALATFRDTPNLFTALKHTVSARLRKQQARLTEEAAIARANAVKRKALAETVSRIAPRSKPGALWRDAIPGLSADTCPEMVTIPPGTFLMGSPATEERWQGYDGREEPQHEVRIEYSFGLGRFAVTVDEFAAFVGDSGHDMGASAYIWTDKGPVDALGKGWRDPGFSQTGRDPVCSVSWHDAQAYVAWLNGKLGFEGRADAYRLPSEAEWEYACRAGTTTPFSFGATISTKQANFDGGETYGAGKPGEHRQKTMPVGSFQANAFGLYDMHGNIWDWCEDSFHENYDNAPNDGSAWTVGGDPSRRVLRGGSWYDNPQSVRSAHRSRTILAGRNHVLGLRLARTLAPR
jgi:formylglycine-generating enzyme required for sulfatase activity